jgi:DNA polymerase III epsilon subunit-like protein
VKVLFIDTETTGLDPKVHGVIQIGAVLAELEGGRLVEKDAREWNLPSDGLVWQKGAALVNGWPGRYEEAMEVVPFWAFSELLGMVGSSRKDVLLGGHNVGFDVDFLDAAWAKGWTGSHVSTSSTFRGNFSHRRVDSQSMAFPLVALGIVPSAGLAALADYYPDLFDDRTAQHTALADARASMRLTNRLIQRADW